MSLSMDGDELHRAATEVSIAAGGLTQDVRQIQATEDREIEAVLLADRGGTANVGVEISFGSIQQLVGSPGTNDATKAQAIATNRGQGAFLVDGLGLEWSAGEELHIHAENNSGAVERISVVVYYREV